MLPLHHDTLYWELLVYYPIRFTIEPATNRININTAATTNGTHNGAVTNHHDQAITLHNFNTIKTMANRPQKLMPPPELLLLLITNLIK